jgi:hypothetical protein
MTRGLKNGWNTVLFRAGLLLIVLGAFHIAVQFISPRDWESNIGWRKPILFGISTGITLISLSWVAAAVAGNKERLVAWIISTLACAEVFIITLQTWRGVPAHFNNGAFLDQQLANAVDAMLVVITLAIFYLTYRTFKTQTVEADYLLAMRLGMIFLAVGCLFGFAVAIYGNLALSAGGNPAVVPPNGVPKFVHGMPLHALQILPAWIFALRFINHNLASRRMSVWFLAGAIALTTLYAVWQTINGFGRFELNTAAAIILFLTVVSGLMTLVLALPNRLLRRKSV